MEKREMERKFYNLKNGKEVEVPLLHQICLISRGNEREWIKDNIGTEEFYTTMKKMYEEIVDNLLLDYDELIKVDGFEKFIQDNSRDIIKNIITGDFNKHDYLKRMSFSVHVVLNYGLLFDFLLLVGIHTGDIDKNYEIITESRTLKNKEFTFYTTDIIPSDSE